MDLFTPIEKETWPRRELFQLFSKSMMGAGFSASVKLRAENLVKLQKARGQKLVPALLYVFAKEISRDPAFTFAVKDGVMGHWDRMHPMYPVLNENGTFTFHTTRADGDYRSFYEAYMREKTEYTEKPAAYASDMPFNCFSISTMNYFPFDSFSFSMNNNYKFSYAPVVSIGKYDENYEMTVSVAVNHAVCDEKNVAELFTRLQAAFDSPEEYLGGC